MFSEAPPQTDEACEQFARGLAFSGRQEPGAKQFRRAQGMAPGGAVKVLLATCPRALLRSTLTAPPSALMRR
jgi:hypothetical protein